VRTVLDRVQPGDIILMHDYIGHNSKTPEALEKIIPILLSQGYEFVTVSALLGIG
jgi:peptidoglycan/xylan/chitin deacetylase (PgdA/CDA1 family)